MADAWKRCFGFSLALTVLLVCALGYLLIVGVGIWGINAPVGWGFAIINFVWWIGIAHAGTLISAILLLFRQEWRTSINRFAEAMTVFAVVCASLFPLIHLGRPWLAYWLLPYSNTMEGWPQFTSPLVWDVFAIGTYAIVSFLFWYVGMLPDLATFRDRATTERARRIYGVLALGWSGAATHWVRYRTAYRLLAGLATALVISVHSIVSFDFAVSNVPGWHSTIFPPYFVAGAIFSGFAMLLTLAIPVRAVYRLQRVITPHHLDKMGKIFLAAGLVVTYGYITEFFMAGYSGNRFERFLVFNRLGGPYAAVFWGLMLCNVAAPQLLWSRRLRHSPKALFSIAMAVNVGMWLERFAIVVTSLHRDFLPSAWGMFFPTFWDWATLAGSAGLFLTLMLLFIRYLPMVPAQPRESEETVVRHEMKGGVIERFEGAAELREAVRRSEQAGLRTETYSPSPLAEGRTGWLGWVALAGGIVGAMAGILVQEPVWDQWPALVPVTFECTVLGAALATVAGMLAGNRLPRFHDPIFDAVESGGYYLWTEDR